MHCHRNLISELDCIDVAVQRDRGKRSPRLFTPKAEAFSPMRTSRQMTGQSKEGNEPSIIAFAIAAVPILLAVGWCWYFGMFN